MENVFWYSNTIGGSGIQSILENIGHSIFKDIDKEIPNTNLNNFFVFLWETDNDINPNIKRPTHSTEFIDLLKKLQNLNFYFIADFSTEAHSYSDNLSLKFISNLISNDIDLNRLILAKNDSYNIGLRKVKYSDYNLNTCFFPHFFINTFLEMKKYVNEKNNLTKEKSFLCLNRRLHKHKFKVLEELHNRNIIDDTFYTAVKSYTNLSKNSFIEFPKQLDNDIMYGEELSVADEYLYKINPNWYYRSKVNLITETIFYTNEIHITEKTWKAIFLGIPFVIFASKNHLHNLRTFGFKTFESIIDEGYDSLSGDDKIPKIIDEGLKLAKIYNSPAVLEIVEYNKNLYQNMENTLKIIDEFFIKQIQKIYSKKSLI